MAEEKIPKLKVEESEKAEIFKEPKDKKQMFKKISNIALWILLLSWMTMCTVDFILSRQERETVFTFINQKVLYEDGHVLKRTGLGYRVNYYNRESYSGIDFGPFWLKDASKNIESETIE